MFQLWFAATPPTDYRSAYELAEASPFPTFQAGMLARGILIQPPQKGLFLPSAAHTDADIDETIAAASEVMPDVVRALDAGLVGATGGPR